MKETFARFVNKYKNPQTPFHPADYCGGAASEGACVVINNGSFGAFIHPNLALDSADQLH